MELFDISIIVLLAPPLMKVTSRHWCSLKKVFISNRSRNLLFSSRNQLAFLQTCTLFLIDAKIPDVWQPYPRLCPRGDHGADIREISRIRSESGYNVFPSLRIRIRMFVCQVIQNMNTTL